MTDSQPPAPGHDEIIMTASAASAVCHSREHARLGVLAEVVVTFGELGTRWQPDALFQDCWGRSYPMCGDAGRRPAQSPRPAARLSSSPAPAPLQPGRPAPARPAGAPRRLAARDQRALTRDGTPASRPVQHAFSRLIPWVPAGLPLAAGTTPVRWGAKGFHRGGSTAFGPGSSRQAAVPGLAGDRGQAQVCAQGELAALRCSPLMSPLMWKG